MKSLVTHELHDRFARDDQLAAYFTALLEAALEGELRRVPIPLLVAMVADEALDGEMIDRAVVMLERPDTTSMRSCEQLLTVVQSCTRRGLLLAHWHVCVQWLDDWLAPSQLLLSTPGADEALLAYLVLVKAQAPAVTAAAVLGAFVSDSAALGGLLLYSPQATCQLLAAHLTATSVPREHVVLVAAHLATLTSASAAVMSCVDWLLVTIAASDPDALSCATVTRAALSLTRQPSSRKNRQLLACLAQTVPQDRVDEQLLLPAFEMAGAHDAAQVMFVRRKEPRRAIQSMLLGSAPPRALTYITAICSSPDCSEQTKEEVLETVVSEVRTLVAISPQWLAQLVASTFPAANLRILNMLARAPDDQYRYVAAMTELQSQSVHTSQIRKETVTRALELAPQYAPAMMIKILRAFPDDYDLQMALSLAQLHRVPQAEAMLLERCGDDQGCLSLMLAALDDELKTDPNGQLWAGTEPSLRMSELPDALTDVLGMCGRAAIMSQLKARFMQVLDHVLVRAPPAHRSRLGCIVAGRLIDEFGMEADESSVQFGMEADESSALSRAAVAIQIAQHVTRKFRDCPIADVEPLLSLLMSEASSTFEAVEVVLESTVQGNIAGHAMCQAGQARATRLSAPWSCAASGQDFCDSEDSIMRVYWCGHLYHHSCTAFSGSDRCAVCKPDQPASRACAPQAPFDITTDSRVGLATDRLAQVAISRQEQELYKARLVAELVGGSAVRQLKRTIESRKLMSLDSPAESERGRSARIGVRNPKQPFSESDRPILDSVGEGGTEVWSCPSEQGGEETVEWFLPGVPLEQADDVGTCS